VSFCVYDKASIFICNAYAIWIVNIIIKWIYVQHFFFELPGELEGFIILGSEQWGWKFLPSNIPNKHTERPSMIDVLIS
jgi:hypothetical protein